MNYILFGEEKSLIQDKLDEILNDNNDALINRYDGFDDVNIIEVSEACRNIGLFNPKNLILYKDPNFLINKCDEKEYSSLLDYVNNPEYETTLVLYTLDNSFNGRLKAFKDFSKNSEVIKFDKFDKKKFPEVANNLINSYKLNIDNDARISLINSCNLDLSLLKMNLNVLSLYPEKIDKDVFKGLITVSDDEDVFNLINSITAKKVNESIIYLRRLLKIEESSLRLIATLSSQLRFLYAVEYYLSINTSKSDIMDLLNVKNIYRIDKAIDTLKTLKPDRILELLSRLSDLDYKIKTSDDIDENLLLELFVVSLIK